MPISQLNGSEVIGIAYMDKDRNIVIDLDFNHRKIGPRGKSRMVFVPEEAAYRTILAKLPRLAQGDTQIVCNNWEV